MKTKQQTPFRHFRLEESERRFLLILGDLLAGFLALFSALYIWASGDEWLGFSLDFLKYRAPGWFYFLPLIWLVLLVDTYDMRKSNNFRNTLKGISLVILVSAVLYLAVYFAAPPSSLPRLGVAVFIIIAAILTISWRLVFIRLFTAANKQRRVLIIGAGRAGSALVEIIANEDPKPFNLVGLIDDDPSKLGSSVRGYPILGNHTNLERLIEDQGVTDMILAISNEMNHGMFQSILSVQERGTQLATMAETYEKLTGRVPISLLESDWVVRSFLERTPTSGFYRLAKRLLDLVLSLVGIFFLIALYPLLALLILIDTGRPIIYKQERLGRGSKPYTIYKFRTMKTNADMVGEALVTSTHDPRITRIGRLLRKTHLDELPQILNVLRGEMSLVGPRSERAELVTIFQNNIPFYRARMLVKPGLTGWAQINQNYAETIEETATKLEYDLYYIEHATFWMDLVIILRTAGSVLGFKGR